jgi:FMN phosphatase YigB (HAD superfamily)
LTTPPASPVRMVCFDAGGVLVRICRSWREGCAAAGVEHRWNDRTQSADAERAAINDAYQRGEIPCGAFFERMAATTDGLYSPAEIMAVHDAWILEEYAGVRALVEALNTADHLATGVLSNTSHRHWEGPHMAGARGVSAVGTVQHPHASHLLGLLKPGPEIYRAFELATGFRGPEILFFDDLADNIGSARGAGWRAEQIDFTDDTAAQITRHLRRHGVHL